MGLFLTFLIQAIFLVIGELLRPKPDLEQAKPGGIGDFQFPTATEQRPIPLVWGTVRIAGPNVIWYGDLIPEPIVKTIKTGLFSSADQITGYKYFIGIQSGLCLGPVDALLGVWVGDDQVIDATGSPITDNTTFTINENRLFGGKSSGGGIQGTLRFFAGSNAQGVSAYLSGERVVSATVGSGGSGYSIGDVLTEAGAGTASVRATFTVLAEIAGVVTDVQLLQGGKYTVQSASPAATTVNIGAGTGCTLNLTYAAGFQHEGGDTPAYHDLCHVLPDTLPTYVGTSLNIKPWKWEVRRTPNGLALTGGKELVDGGANPMNVIYEAFTNADWGYGMDPASVDVANFSAAASTLFDEGNGFSFVLDSPEDLGALVIRVEEQVDGILFMNPLSGKWQIKLARADYDIALVPELNATNTIAVRSFSRGTWEGTSNQVHVPFFDASEDYKATYGFAQDMANVRIVGANITVEIAHPGVKSRVLATAIASRELRTLSVPLAQASFVVDRSLYGLLPGDVFGFTNADAGFVRLPMRVKSIDYGSLLEGRITIEAVQDVFFAAAGLFEPAPHTGWTPPAANLVAFPVAQQLAFEAPRALTLRDPLLASATADKVYAAARRQGIESTFLMVQRNAAGTPSGGFEEFGQVVQFALIGVLQNALPAGSGYPLSTVQLLATPDTQAALVNAFPSSVDLSELGNELTTLCLVDDEFLLIESAQTNAGLVQLNNIYRGTLDSVQADHAAGAHVFLIFVGGGMSADSIPVGNTVDVKLLPQSLTQDLPDALATAITFTMANRTRRPMPPASFDLNGTTLDKVLVDLDGSGSGEDVGVLVDAIVRRDFRTVDEIAALLDDAAVLAADFPTANTTEVEIEIRDGLNVLASTTGISGTSATMRQLDILAGLDATTLPASLTIGVRQSHTFKATVYKSRSFFDLTFTVSSPLVGKHALGELDQSEVSTAYAVQSGDDSTDHVFNLSSSFTVGDVEYRINGGAWTTLIAAGGTGPGTIPNASLSVSDTIEVKHESTDTTPQKLLTMTVGGVEEAYAVLIS